MYPFVIITIVWAAMIAMGFWEAYVEGRNPWDKRKLGWKLKIGKFYLPAYHFYVFFIMLPLLVFILPLSIYGWSWKLFGILLSAYFTGLVIEDFVWFLVNPAVKLKEFHTEFTDYYPWIKINGKKIIPTGYLIGPVIAILSWFFLWR